MWQIRVAATRCIQQPAVHSGAPLQQLPSYILRCQMLVVRWQQLQLTRTNLLHQSSRHTCPHLSSTPLLSPTLTLLLFPPLTRTFSSKAPRRMVELHPAQAARQHPKKKKHDKEKARVDAFGEVLLETKEEELEKNEVDPNEVIVIGTKDLHNKKSPEVDLLATTISVPAESISSTPVTTRPGPTTIDAQGRHHIRTKLHPDGAICGRGRVVANFGTRMLVQEVPWDDQAEVKAAKKTDLAEADRAPTYPVDGTRFVCMPRGKLGKIVCGDIVLWEWSANHADAEAFIVEVLPRQTEFLRVDKNSTKHGRDMVLLASNFHHMCIVCASQPATNGMLLDRYLAAANRMRVTASIIFNKVDLIEEAKRFRPVMDDFRRIGVPVFETSTTNGTGIEEIRKHLGQVGPNGAPGITIFVGQSGSGKSSLLNALSPSLQLRVNELSRNHQGRHTTTQTILHQLESGGEIIDSPGFQNYIPSPLPMREVAAGFSEFTEPAKYCHYGSRCLHVTEPDCGVRLAVRGSASDLATAIAKSQEVHPKLDLNQPVDQRAVIATAYQNALLAGLSELPGEQSDLDQQRNSGALPAWRKKDWESTRRTRQQEIDDIAIENQQLKIKVMEGGNNLTQGGNKPKPPSPEPDQVELGVKAHSPRTLKLTEDLLNAGLLDTISKRRYESYLELIGQQQELEKNKYS